MKGDDLFAKLSAEDRDEILLIVESQIEKMSISEHEKQILKDESDRLGIDPDLLLDYINQGIEQRVRVASITENKEKALKEFIKSSLEDNVISVAERKVIYAKARSLGYSTEEADAMIVVEQDAKEMAKSKFWYIIKKCTGIETMEFVGLCFALVAFILTLFNYRYTEPGKIMGLIPKETPRTLSAWNHLPWATIISFVTVGFLYIRKLMTFANSNKIGQWISIVLNVCMFAGVIALYGDALHDVFVPETTKGIMLFSSGKMMAYCVLVFILTMLLFGQRGLAKVAFIIGFISIFASAIIKASEATQFVGMVLIICIFSSLFFQENIKFKELAHDLSIAYRSGSQFVSGSLLEASDEMEQAGKVIGSAAKSALAKNGIQLGGIEAAPVERQIGTTASEK